MLFLPKIAGAAIIALRGERGYGGRLHLAASMLVEMVMSALLAPIRMLFHTEFVLSALLGWRIQWKSPPRDDAETSWAEAARRHGAHTALGIAWAALVYWLNPSFLWWLLPVVGALMLSIPISVYSSRVALGRRLRRAGFFLIPEETAPPPEIRCAQETTRSSPPPAGLAEAVAHPVINALACASGVPRPQGATTSARAALVRNAARAGIAALTPSEKNELLRDPMALTQLHIAVTATGSVHGDSRTAAGARPSHAGIRPAGVRTLQPKLEM